MITTTPVTNEAAWRSALAHLPDPHPLQSFAWGSLKSRWGWSMRPTLFHRDGKLAGAAMMLKRRLGPSGLSMIYIPKGPVCDFQDKGLRQELFARLPVIAKKERAIFVKIDPDIPVATGEEGDPLTQGEAVVNDLQTAGWLYSPEQIQFRNTVLLDLTQSEDALLAAMKQKTRYNIRLAGRKEVRVRPGNDADWPLVLDLYRETSERDNFLIRPDAYYFDAWQTLFEAGVCQPFIAFYNDLPLGAVLIVHGGRRAIYMYGASTHRERSRMPNYLLQWEAIRWAKAQGYAIYDFWGAPDIFNPEDRLWGVWQFKKGFNGTVTHHLGAWDYPVNRPLYQFFTRALPRYRQIVKRVLSPEA